MSEWTSVVIGVAVGLVLLGIWLSCDRSEGDGAGGDTSNEPSEQWWVINGQELLDALRRVRDGDDPDLAYLELHANARSES